MNDTGAHSKAAHATELVRALASRARQLLLRLEHGRLAPALAGWPSAAPRVGPAPSPPRLQVPPSDSAQAPPAEPPATLAVLGCIGSIRSQADSSGGGIVEALCDAAGSLVWRQTYTAEQTSRAFIDNYGYCEIVGAHGPLCSRQLACGFLLLGPDTHYPSHHHEAEEFYVPLSGTALWQQGAEPWRERVPMTLIHHVGHEPHAMRTMHQPLLALYLWLGRDVSEPARLVPTGARE